MITSRKYTVKRIKAPDLVFTSVSAFDGYVKEVRIAGYTVTFSTPFFCVVERAK